MINHLSGVLLSHLRGAVQSRRDRQESSICGNCGNPHGPRRAAEDRATKIHKCVVRCAVIRAASAPLGGAAGAAGVDGGPGSGKCANPFPGPLGATPGRATKIHNWVAWRPLIRIRKAQSESACGNCANGPGPLALTPRTPIPRLPALCLSGPFRSELSARSADRGRVVPVLDRLSGRSFIAPFAPSFP